MKTGHVAPGTAKMSPGSQNMRKGPATPDGTENVSGSAKHEKWTRHSRCHRKLVWERKTRKQDATTSVPSKTRPDTLDTAKNESRRAKQENGTRRLGTAENESGRTKRENGTRRTRYRRKHV
jgi:hypothetical protein